MPVVGEVREVALDEGAEFVVVIEPGVVYGRMAYPFDKSLRLSSVDWCFWKDADSEDSIDASLRNRKGRERMGAGGVPVVRL